MRIISGQFRGRKLRGPRNLSLRPTSDRLKETLFNILARSIRDSVLLDVFAGTGAIGLEALSREAREVVFIESSSAACRLIRQNLDLCGITRGYRIIQSDVFKALRSLGREQFCADIAFLDPPYGWQPYSDLLDVIFRTGLVHAQSVVVVEHHRKASLPDSSNEYDQTRIVRQSDKCLSFYQMTIDK